MKTTMLMKFGIGVLLATPMTMAYAQDEARSAGDGEVSAASVAPAKKSRTQKSRLTRDESEAAADRRKILLSTGEDKTVDLDFETNDAKKNITIGNEAIVIPQLVKIGDKRQIVFKPLKKGDTTVTIRDDAGIIKLIFNVKVTDSNLLRVAGEIRDLLRDVEGIDVRVVGQKVVVEGEVLVPADYGKVATVIEDKVYRDSVFNMVTLSPLAMQVLAKRIQDDVNSFAPNVKTRVVNGVIFLEGTVDNLDQAKRSEKVASLYLPDIKPKQLIERAEGTPPDKIQGRKLIENFLVINPPAPKKQEKLVRITVHFVELAKDYSKIFGFKWAPGFTANPQISVGTDSTGAAGASGTSFSATLSSLIPKLKNAQEAGYARVLRTGNLLVRSGQPAQVQDQVQIPFLNQGANGTTTTTFQPVGFSVGVTPQILGQSEDIAMEIKMEQSAVGARTPAGNGINTHKVDTKIYVKSNESAAIAGVTQSNVGTTFNKDPNTAGEDPLFKLYRSKDFSKQRSQFVIFVTPQIVENASDGTEDLKKNFRVKVK